MRRHLFFGTRSGGGQCRGAARQIPDEAGHRSLNRRELRQVLDPPFVHIKRASDLDLHRVDAFALGIFGRHTRRVEAWLDKLLDEQLLGRCGGRNWRRARAWSIGENLKMCESARCCPAGDWRLDFGKQQTL